MKRVYLARNPADAHLAAGALAGEGLAAVVRGEDLWTARGEVPLTPDTGPSVWVVDDRDADRAMAVLAALQQEGGGEGEAWTCAECGEAGEPGFDACWRCGAVRPG